MIILLDLDVLLDVALDRRPFAEAASVLLDAIESRRGTAFMAWHSIANFFYLTSPKHGRDASKEYIVELTRFVAIAKTGTDSLRFAANLPMRDFEDAMQVAAAQACGAEVIATRNLKDYRKSPIRAAAPQALVKELR